MFKHHLPIKSQREKQQQDCQSILTTDVITTCVQINKFDSRGWTKYVAQKSYTKVQMTQNATSTHYHGAFYSAFDGNQISRSR